MLSQHNERTYTKMGTDVDEVFQHPDEHGHPEHNMWDEIAPAAQEEIDPGQQGIAERHMEQEDVDANAAMPWLKDEERKQPMLVGISIKRLERSECPLRNTGNFSAV